jgi:hypothetical protein
MSTITAQANTDEFVAWMDEAPDDDLRATLPTYWAICQDCQGEGHHAKHIGEITSDQWNHEWDEDERESYLRGGYDTRCDTCDGSGKVREIRREGKMTDQQRRILETLDRRSQERRECEAIQRAEMRMCGYLD